MFNQNFSMGTSNVNCALDNGRDVWTIAMHEFGHYAGLAHTDEDQDDSMYESYTGCKRNPSSHDQESMNEQYHNHP